MINSELNVTPPPSTKEVPAGSLLWRWLYSVYLRLTDEIRFFIHKNGSDQTISNNSSTTVTFSTIVKDSLSGWDSNNNYYIVQNGGPHLVCIGVRWNYTMTGGTDEMSIVLNQNGIEIASDTLKGTTHVNPRLQIVKILETSSGDILQLKAFQVTSGSRDIEGDSNKTYFQLHRI